MQYGPLSYFSLSRVYPRVQTRRPYPRKSRRPLLFLDAVVQVRRTVSVTVALSLSAGDKLRVVASRVSGTATLNTEADGSTFTLNT